MPSLNELCITVYDMMTLELARGRYFKRACMMIINAAAEP
jgi:hypothetical protein